MACGGGTHHPAPAAWRFPWPAGAARCFVYILCGGSRAHSPAFLLFSNRNKGLVICVLIELWVSIVFRKDIYYFVTNTPWKWAEHGQECGTHCFLFFSARDVFTSVSSFVWASDRPKEMQISLRPHRWRKTSRRVCVCLYSFPANKPPFPTRLCELPPSWEEFRWDSLLVPGSEFRRHKPRVNPP